MRGEQQQGGTVQLGWKRQLACGTAWNRSLQGLCGAKQPGVSSWRAPPVEELISGGSQQLQC